MKLTIGYPQGGICVEIEVEKAEDVPGEVADACDALRAGAEAWKDWTFKNETPEEKAMREANEEHARLQLQVKEQQIGQMRRMLDGKSDVVL